MPHQIKRIHKELKDYDHIIDGEKCTVHFLYKKRMINVVFERDYPFYPPNIFINGSRLAYSPSFIPNRILVDYVKSKHCPCCNTITCVDRWTPAFSILDILKEYTCYVKEIKDVHRVSIIQNISFPKELIKEISSYII